ncbi:MAG: methylmalonyl-CoA mutase [Armatimonadetes bacterium]|nr:methylmalonyl-CoA mutase [Armatimonadota bacterium]
MPKTAKKERKNVFTTPSGVRVERVYGPREGTTSEYLEKVGFPGEFPFTRGVQPNMYRGKLWTMRQYAGFGTAKETNGRFKLLLDRGQTGLSVAFDLPTQMGYDSDDPAACGEIGRVGVAVDSLQDLEVLLEGIPLDRVSISMTINATAAILLAMLVAVARRRGVPPGALSGTVQNDILKEYIARGTYIFPVGPSMRLAADLIQYVTENLPRWNPISISGYHMREAGATAVQELAFTLANAKAYVREVLNRGVSVDSFASRLSFFFCCHNYFFEEIAKFRAARRIWAHIMRDEFGARDPRSQTCRFHTQTAGCSLTAQQPLNNIARVSFQALAAVLGGTQSLHTNSYDEALCLPTEESSLIALRTQQILASETGTADTVDPLGGSHFVEALTDRIEEDVRAYLRKIEDMGGTLAAVEKGFMQQEIQSSAFEFQQKVENGEEKIVGVNCHQVLDRSSLPRSSVNLELEQEQKEKLRILRAGRKERAVLDSLGSIRKTAGENRNLLPDLLSAVENLATLGEICGALRTVWGGHR